MKIVELATRRRAWVKATVVLLGLAWCSSVPLGSVVPHALAGERAAAAPDPGPAAFEEGLAHAHRGHWKEARGAFFQEALAPHPSVHPALVMGWLEHCARQIGGPPEVIATFAMLARLVPGDGLCRLFLARALVTRGREGDIVHAAALVRAGIAAGDGHAYDFHRLAASIALARADRPGARAAQEAALGAVPLSPFMRAMVSGPPVSVVAARAGVARMAVR